MPENSPKTESRTSNVRVNKPEVAIAGGGIAGLNTGIELLRKGYQNVRIFEAAPYQEGLSTHPEKQKITRRASEAGTAQFFPFVEGGITGEEMTEQVRWIEEAVEEYQRREVAGIYKDTMAKRRNFELVKEDQAKPLPAYLKEILERFGPVREFGEVPRNPLGFVYGYDFVTWAINSPAALKALRKEFKELGGNFVTRKIHNADEFYSLSKEVIVNSMGLGAQEVFPALNIEPVKGHMMFYQNPGIDRIVSAEDLIVLPRSDKVLVVGAGYIHDFQKDEPTEEEARDILGRVEQMTAIDLKEFEGIHEKLLSARLLGETSGFRPYRKEGVLVAAQAGPDNQIVVNNVGHGGMGWTLAGTGKAAVRLIEERI